MKHVKFKVALMTLMTVFNLAICFAGALAWFTAAKTNNASNMQVQMYTHELDMSYRVYKYSDDEKAIINATGRDDALSLQEYDSVFEFRNANTPIIIEFAITGMDLGENIPVYIDALCNAASTVYNAKLISNIIELKFGVFNSITSSDPTTIYNSALMYFNSIESIKFVSGTSKTTTVSYQLNNYASQLLDGSLRLYIKLDYSKTLIDTNFKPYFDFTDADTMTFDNDLTWIRCRT